MSENVLEQELGAASILHLNRAGNANALNGAIVDELHDAFERTKVAGKRLVVFTGAGRHFSSGFDFSDYLNQSHGELLLRFVRIEEFLQRVRYASCVTAAFVHGVAFGAGADLVAACALRIGKSSAQFRFPGSRFGVVLGTRHLASVLGGGRAREVLSVNRTLGTEEALSCSLLTELASNEVGVEDFTRTTLDYLENLDPSVTRQIGQQVASARMRHDDLGVLVESLARPGLHGRIENYLKSAKANK